MKYTERPVGVLGVMLSKDELERMTHARYHGGGRHRQRKSEQEFWARLDSLNRSLDQMETKSDADEGAHEYFPVTLGDSLRVRSAIETTLTPKPADPSVQPHSSTGTQTRALSEVVAAKPDDLTEETLANNPLPIPEDAWITELRSAAHTLHTMRPKTAPVRAASPSPARSAAAQTLSPTQLQMARVSKPSRRTGADRQPFYFSLEAPATASSGEVRVQSPYELELARLRLERLRLEEAHLLQVARLAEIERTRAPQENWYEMRGPRFFYESRKNTQLLHVGSRGTRSPTHDPTRVPSAAFVGGSLTASGLEELRRLKAFREELKHEARRFHDQFTAYTLVD